MLECHGNIHRLQCVRGRACVAEAAEPEAWDDAVHLEVDAQYRATSALPACPRCGALARPNVWMCTDPNYVLSSRTASASRAYQRWLSGLEEGARVVVVELGAGLVIPSARVEAEEVADRFSAPLIRINPVDYGAPLKSPRGIGLPFGAAEGMRALERALRALRSPSAGPPGQGRPRGPHFPAIKPAPKGGAVAPARPRRRGHSSAHGTAR